MPNSPRVVSLRLYHDALSFGAMMIEEILEAFPTLRRQDVEAVIAFAATSGQNPQELALQRADMGWITPRRT